MLLKGGDGVLGREVGDAVGSGGAQLLPVHGMQVAKEEENLVKVGTVALGHVRGNLSSRSMLTTAATSFQNSGFDTISMTSSAFAFSSVLALATSINLRSHTATKVHIPFSP